ncbi:TetR/AcrR family transcriptional regulator [Nonomuraea muscovyensis]|uniref:AcrR family transcriptional regulator n=1 Tax=Nonomuraea muscovyensis TaxID=1124761 RepID=A0A7X0C2P7_9ACTN|nr:TetR/AcrR family transcriptional regulator [Nonomuraea muscovyensis]MBB6347257.1 AcrR family transcriptional regulator [Nonomuraea muscovyensis]
MADAAPSRLDRRKARTRAALIHAAQTFIADGRTNAAILDLTQAADVGMGSFYNHFSSKDELFRAAVEDALDRHGAGLDELTRDMNDPAEVFAYSFRLTGRLHRRHPQLSKVLLNTGLTIATSEHGIAPRVRRDIQAGIQAGRFTINDPELAFVIATGTALCLGQLLHTQPDRDDAQATDQITEDLLRTFGIPADEAHEICQRPLPDLDRLLLSTTV